MNAPSLANSFLLDLQKDITTLFQKGMNTNDFLSLIRGKKISLYSPFDYSSAEKELSLIHDLIVKLDWILQEPRTISDTREIIIKAEKSGPLSPQSFLETTKDSKLWKSRLIDISPDEVHSLESYESPITYENKFICLLITSLREYIEDYMASLLPMLASFESSIMDASINYGPYSFLNYLPSNKKGIGGILDEGKGGKRNIATLYKKGEEELKKVIRMQDSQFYQLVNDQEFTKSPFPTNILLHDPYYSYCYRYYKKHILVRKERFISEEAPYYNFVVLSLISFLNESHQYIRRPSKNEYYLDINGRLSFEKMGYRSGELFYTIFPKPEIGALKIKVDYGDINMDYCLLIRRRRDKTDKAQLDELIDELLEDYDAVKLITSEDSLGDYRSNMPLSYFRKDNSKLLNNFLSSLALFFKADTSLYKDKCPVCGKGHTHTSFGKRECLDCHATYRLIENKGLIWISGFRRG